MVKPSRYRSKRYDKKLDADVERIRALALDRIKKEQMRMYQVRLTRLQDYVLRICSKYGIMSNAVAYYTTFTQQVSSACRNFSGKTLDKKVREIYSQYKKKGLRSQALFDLIKFACPRIDPYSWPLMCYAKMCVARIAC